MSVGTARSASCVDDLQPNSGAAALLGCLKEMQAEIERIAAVQPIKGDKGDKGDKGPRGFRGDPAAFPEGIIVASVRPCPDIGREWRSYDNAGGRFLIGVGASTDTRKETKAFKFEETNGAYQHLLTVKEMPKHDHDGIFGGDGGKAGMNNEYAYHSSGYRKIRSEGGGEPHNNMPPYVAVYFCKREF
ncbi:MAG: hypothetical protein AAF074_09355 [Pseudomonadota bacterium]